MNRTLRVGCVGLFLAVAMASTAPAATIQEVMGGPFGLDPTMMNFLDYVYGGGRRLGQSGYFLTWNNVGSNNLFDPQGQPGATFAHTKLDNPPDLKFLLTGGTGGGNGGGGGGTGGLPAQTTYLLGNHLGGDWWMTFSMLFFDPDFGDNAPAGVPLGVTVELWGTEVGTDYKTKILTADEIRNGALLAWDIEGGAGEDVMVRVTSSGDETYAAGFFMDNAVFLPEPATVGLMAVGLAAVVWRRRK